MARFLLVTGVFDAAVLCPLAAGHATPKGRHVRSGRKEEEKAGRDAERGS